MQKRSNALITIEEVRTVLLLSDC